MWLRSGQFVANTWKAAIVRYFCPCLLGTRDERGSALAQPTDGYCNAPMLFLIHDGYYGEVRLNGTKVGLAIHTPAAMGLGNWTFALYLDKNATPEHHEATEKIYSGQSGGVVGRFFGPLIKTACKTASSQWSWNAMVIGIGLAFLEFWMSNTRGY